jgi:poly [ADP-ribose] polymerase
VKINKLEQESEENKLIQELIRNTSGSCVDFKTHKVEVYHIQRKGELERFQKFQEVGNRRLLFHGSSMFNFMSILTQGLRIAPPEAPSNGFMFGKGVYFADMF